MLGSYLVRSDKGSGLLAWFLKGASGGYIELRRDTSVVLVVSSLCFFLIDFSSVIAKDESGSRDLVQVLDSVIG